MAKRQTLMEAFLSNIPSKVPKISYLSEEEEDDFEVI